MRHCALILGGYVNGYSILQELHSHGVNPIIVADRSRSAASRSRFIHSFLLLPDASKEGLYESLSKLREEYDKIVIFPTDDLYLEQLYELRGSLDDAFFLPFNASNIIQCLDKSYQHKICETNGFPHPKSKRIRDTEELTELGKLTFPIIVKPLTRVDLRGGFPRNLLIPNVNELNHHLPTISTAVRSGIQLICSEVIPGPGSAIYAYSCYRNKDGQIMNEWVGRKLAQFPDDFGVFSSASSGAPDTVWSLGRQIVTAMDAHGFAEPEFKFDERDGEFKLMEVNLRPMMWNRIGYLSGVPLLYSQYLDAIEQEVPKFQQNSDSAVRLIYLKHEIANLIGRKNYWKTFRENLRLTGDRHFALWDLTDPKPSFYDSVQSLRLLVKTCGERFSGGARA